MSNSDVTIEDFLIGLETDHGYEQTTYSYFSEDARVCAYGNAALDIAKRTGQQRSKGIIDAIAGNLNEAFSQYVRRKMGNFETGGTLDILSLNDVYRKSFTEIARDVRERIQSSDTMSLNDSLTTIDSLKFAEFKD